MSFYTIHGLSLLAPIKARHVHRGNLREMTQQRLPGTRNHSHDLRNSRLMKPPSAQHPSEQGHKEYQQMVTRLIWALRDNGRCDSLLSNGLGLGRRARSGAFPSGAARAGWRCAPPRLRLREARAKRMGPEP